MRRPGKAPDKGRGEPLMWEIGAKEKRYQPWTCGDDCWAGIFLGSEDSFPAKHRYASRANGRRSEAAEEDGSHEQVMMGKMRAKGRMDAQSIWWVGDLLAGLSNTWFHPTWVDTMQAAPWRKSWSCADHATGGRGADRGRCSAKGHSDSCGSILVPQNHGEIMHLLSLAQARLL